MKQVLKLAVVFFILTSCKSARTNGSAIIAAQLYANQLTSLLCKKENFTHDDFNIHINIERLNENYYKCIIVLNNYVPEKYSFKGVSCGINTFTYIAIANPNESLDRYVFFVPDSKMWEFLILTNKDEILSVNELVLYEPSIKGSVDDVIKLD